MTVKIDNVQEENSEIILQSIDPGLTRTSSMFRAKIREVMYTPANPSLTI